uniref:Transposase n=1 Tax=Acrobeloides nanus TaxID=290746 RepID=A0A914EA58_9BILA
MSVSNIYRRWQRTREVERRPKSGRPRITTERDERNVVRLVKEDPTRTSTDVMDKVRGILGRRVSRSTAQRVLRRAKLFGRRPSKKPLISKKNQKARRAYAKKYKDQDPAIWNDVIWSDWTKINLVGSDGIRYVRRPPGMRNYHKYTTKTVKHGGGSIMVWGCFCAHDLGPLIRSEGKVTSPVYRDVLEQHMVPFSRQVYVDGGIFMQDNDPKHGSPHVARSSKLMRAWFRRNRTRVLDHPPQSPDLNPIEHLWEELKRRAKGKKFRNKDEAWAFYQAEWNKIPLETLQKLVASMPRRLQAVYAAKGQATKY